MARYLVRTKHDRQLGLGKMLGNTSMVTESKTKWILGRPLAVHVKVVGVLEDFFVSICRLVGSNNTLIRLDQLVHQRVSFTEFIAWRPLRPTLPPISTSSFAVRLIASADAVWNRQSSSTNLEASEGSDFSWLS